MTMPRAVAVFGLGLMGGSLARDLAERGIRVAAYDRRPEVLDSAIAAGTVQSRIDPDARPPEPADLYVLAAPVDASIELLRRLAPHLPPETLVTDVGSTKLRICREAAELGLAGRFVGSHPMTGDHRSGWDAARPGLYRDAPVFLCGAGDDAGPLHTVADFWRGLGARPVVIDAREHDRRMAWVSHLPQVLASSLARTLAAAGFAPADLGPGGRDMTRLAASSPEMWAAIARANSDELREAVRAAQHDLSLFLSALDLPDDAALLRFFRDGRSWLP